MVVVRIIDDRVFVGLDHDRGARAGGFVGGRSFGERRVRH
jgi:hypothetical protein